MATPIFVKLEKIGAFVLIFFKNYYCDLRVLMHFPQVKSEPLLMYYTKPIMSVSLFLYTVGPSVSCTCCRGTMMTTPTKYMYVD